MSPVTYAVTVALALGASAACAADPVYKSTMPDGRVVYGESPMHGARRVDKVAAPPVHAGVITVTPGDKARVGSTSSDRGPNVLIIPEQKRPPIQPAQQGYSANPHQALPARGY